MGKLTVLDHPMVKHKLTHIRDINTNPRDFRDLVEEVTILMAYEATKDLPLKDVEIETPVSAAKTQVIAGKKLVLVPILRAGLGMLNGMLKVIPQAKVGHIGLYRDHETLQPIEYYCNMPSNLANRELMLLDPMLATGGSAVAAISLLKKRGAPKIKLLCIIAAPEGIKAVQEAHPDVDIFVATVDSHLNDKGYIVPGLGDAGDRLYGTL
ncbi:MAG: uracil phosphoribosyltransferase [Peptococcia bacterium]